MELPSWIDIEAWNGFIEMRKSIKKPLTPRAMVLAIHKLEKLLKEGHDPTSVLDQSTFNSWQGLYPLKDGGLNGQNPVGIGRAGGDRVKQRAREKLGLGRGNSGSPSQFHSGPDPAKDRGRMGKLESGLDSEIIDSTALEITETQ